MCVDRATLLAGCLDLNAFFTGFCGVICIFAGDQKVWMAVEVAVLHERP